jgi:hypothetical protein
VKSKEFNALSLSFTLFLIFFIPGCSDTGDTLHGTWQNDFGQTFVFNDDNTAFWVFKSGDVIDTFYIKYKVDYYSEPVTLDLYGFKIGPLTGQTLFGIIEFENNSFNCDFEAGYNEKIRPKEFDPEQTQKYRRRVSDF